MNDQTQSQNNLQSPGYYFAQGFGADVEMAEHSMLRQYTLRLLRRRCGDLTEEIQALVYALPDESVYSLADALFDFSSQEDLRNWLQAKMADPVLRRITHPHSLRLFGDA